MWSGVSLPASAIVHRGESFLQVFSHGQNTYLSKPPVKMERLMGRTPAQLGPDSVFLLLHTLPGQMLDQLFISVPPFVCGSESIISMHYSSFLRIMQQ